jgi:DNA repair exonuclease SbcCD nuclease subunit
MQALRKLNKYFNKTYIIVGNHDLFWRDRRDIHAMVITTEFPNIILVDNLTTIENVTFIPWLVEDEWKSIIDLSSKYIFGHLELPGFKMNAMVEMPDHEELNLSHFKNSTHVFSGHFHKRQTKNNITYIGNPFGHNYSDVWDFERGAMFLEWDKDPVFLNYADGPRYIDIGLTSLLENPDIYLKPKTYLRVTLDANITYEEASFLRETLLGQYKVREFKLVKNQDDDLKKDFSNNVIFKTVDQIVTESLLAGIDKDSSFDSKLLVEIYNGL